MISDTDRDLLALARELGAVLYTDDFAIQNVASVLGVQTHPITPAKGKTGSLEIPVQRVWAVF